MANETRLSTEIAAAVTKKFEKKALDNLRANLVFNQFFDHRDIPANTGTSFNVYRIDEITGDTTVTSEGSIGTPVTMTANTADIAVAQYTKSVKLTDILLKQHRASIVMEALDRLGFTMKKVLDLVGYTELKAEAADFFPNSKSALSTVGSADVLNAIALRQIAAKLENSNVMPVSGGDYLLAVHPYQLHDLRGDDNIGGWLDVTKYTSNAANAGGKPMNAERGSLWGFRILNTSVVSSVTAGTSGNARVYSAIAGGKQAGIDVSLSSLPNKMIFKGLGSSGAATDPADQIASVAYKASYAAEMIDDVGTDADRAYEVQTGASYSG